VLSVADASKWADVIMVLIPDQHQARVYKSDIEQHLSAGKMLMFAHGFAIRFNWIVPPKDVDVTMVAPKAPGHRVREVFKEGAGTPGLLAVHQDVTGKGRSTALSYARGIGCTRAGVIETTFAEETETDLFGETGRALRRHERAGEGGARNAPPSRQGIKTEIAYFECLHEPEADRRSDVSRRPAYMRYSYQWDTAEYGDYTAGSAASSPPKRRRR
jgi:ketol-acid reductoisomerase